MLGATGENNVRWLTTTIDAPTSCPVRRIEENRRVRQRIVHVDDGLERFPLDLDQLTCIDGLCDGLGDDRYDWLPYVAHCAFGENWHRVPSIVELRNHRARWYHVVVGCTDDGKNPGRSLCLFDEHRPDASVRKWRPNKHDLGNRRFAELVTKELVGEVGDERALTAKQFRIFGTKDGLSDI